VECLHVIWVVHKAAFHDQIMASGVAFESSWRPFHPWVVCVCGVQTSSLVLVTFSFLFSFFSLFYSIFMSEPPNFQSNPSVCFTFRYGLYYFDYYLFYFKLFIYIYIYIYIYSILSSFNLFSFVKFDLHSFDCYLFCFNSFSWLDFFFNFIPYIWFHFILMSNLFLIILIFICFTLVIVFQFHPSMLNCLGIKLIDWTRVKDFTGCEFG